MATTIRWYYHKEAWEFAFRNTQDRIVFDADGNVYKNSIAFMNLVVTFNGIVGAAGYNSEGDVTIWANPADAYTGAIHASVMTGRDSLNVVGGTQTVGEYFHFALVIDNVNSIIRLYINGVQVATTTILNPVQAFRVFKQAMMGRYIRLSDTDSFEGNIDDFRVYGKVLTGGNINDIFEWGNQQQEYQKRVWIPSKEAFRGHNCSVKMSGNEYVEFRQLGLTFDEVNVRS